MERLRLVIPDETMLEEIRSYRQAMLDAGSSMDGCGTLRREEAPSAWLHMNNLLSCEETVPENWVPSTQYVCIREGDGRIVGMIQLRHRFNAFLEHFGGHIGYSVRPDERRRGYAAWMLRQLLPIARSMGLESVLITCEQANEGSRRTILSCGGEYESTVHEPEENVLLERYWVKLM